MGMSGAEARLEAAGYSVNEPTKVLQGRSVMAAIDIMADILEVHGGLEDTDGRFSRLLREASYSLDLMSEKRKAELRRVFEALRDGDALGPYSDVECAYIDSLATRPVESERVMGAAEYSDEAKKKFTETDWEKVWQKAAAEWNAEQAVKHAQYHVDYLAKRGYFVWPRPIPVSDRLPEVKQLVLVFWCGGWTCAWHETDNHWEFEFEDEETGKRFRVPDDTPDMPTHWLPLPPPILPNMD